MTQGDEYIWVVAECGKDTVNTAAYDNESDAENYCLEMRERRDGDSNISVIKTKLNRRDEYIPSDDAPWGMLRMDIKSEFVEGLMEDMVPSGRIKPGAAERFVSERVCMVRRRALERIDRIVTDETKDELIQTQNEWSTSKSMED